jgi:hypothetical protein
MSSISNIGGNLFPTVKSIKPIKNESTHKTTAVEVQGTDGNIYGFALNKENGEKGTSPLTFVNTVRTAEHLAPYYQVAHPTLQIDNPSFRPPAVHETLQVPGLPDPITVHYTEGFDGTPELEIPFGSQANELAISGFSLAGGIHMMGNPVHSTSTVKSTDATYWKTTIGHGVGSDSPLVSGEKLPLKQLEEKAKQWVEEVNPHQLLEQAKALPQVGAMPKQGGLEAIVPASSQAKGAEVDAKTALMSPAPIMTPPSSLQPPYHV